MMQDPLGGGAATGQAIGGFGASATAAGTASPGDFEVVDIGDVDTGGKEQKKVGGAGKGGKKAENVRVNSGALREGSLAEREKELQRREEELERRTGQVINPMRVNNWPPCYPILHHDIQKDVPAGKRAVARLCVSTALFFNCSLSVLC
jgi:hypothetical protein